ncbi:hypothetical protein ERJ75_001063000 [Trypanosoma vivax]|nr:hypothetical protein TRVL_05588 [Trypanosoma vivax]KAH8610754.1 hypothetical protein ERJ75_001063000 [Trypanosoma vivax]
MISVLPPIVALPSNLAETHRPVPVFIDSCGLYDAPKSCGETEDAPWCGPGTLHKSNAAGVSSRERVAESVLGTSVLRTSSSALTASSQSIDTIDTHPPNSYEGGSSSLSHKCEMERMTDQDVDDLLSALEERYRKYTEDKQRKTEQYLARIEKYVERFLLTHYSNGSSRLGGAVAAFFKNGFSTPFHMVRNAGKTSGESRAETIISESNHDGKTCSGGESTGNRDDREGCSLPPLAESVYTPRCIPFNYLDERPSNMKSIAANIVVLRHCLAERVAHATTGQREFLGPIIQSVWSQALDPLYCNATNLLTVAFRNVKPPLEYVCLQQGDETASTPPWRQRRERYSRVVMSLQGDVTYLETIRDMDQKFMAGAACNERDGVSDFVPVSGLALSHLHRLENEHRTVWEFWRAR